MPLKTVTVEGVTYAAVQDGKPVYTLPTAARSATTAKNWRFTSTS